MSSSSDVYTQLRQTRDHLSAPIPDVDTLLRLLCLPLDLIDLLDQSLQRYGTSTRPPQEVKANILLKWIPSLQSVILEHVLVDWYDALTQEGRLEGSIVQYFVPSSMSPQAALVAASAYDILLNAISRHGQNKEYRVLPDLALRFILDMLGRLSERYSVDVLHRGIFEMGLEDDARELLWGDVVTSVVSVPVKVANYFGSRGREMPEVLLPPTYFGKLSGSVETLIFQLSSSTRTQQEMSVMVDSLSLLMQKLLRVGLFPADCHSQPFPFFGSTYHILERRVLAPLDSESGAAVLSYSFFWQRLLGTLTSMDSRQVMRSLLSCLNLPTTLSPSATTRQSIKRNSYLLFRLIGNISPTSESSKERWDNVIGLTVASRQAEWSIGMARVVVCWASGLAGSNTVNVISIEALARAVLQIWSDPTFIKHSLRSRHEYMTAMLLLSVSCLPAKSDELISLSRDAAFIQSITVYMEHPDPSIRRLGLLTAEVLSSASAGEGKSLSFGAEMWEGQGEGKEFCRELRSLIAERDGDSELVLEPQPEPADHTAVEHPAPAAERQPRLPPADSVDSDDDSLVGYDSPEDHSRAPSPTPEELEEIEKDPTLNNPKKKKVAKPVYLADLGTLFQDSKDVEKLEVALSSAEELIRRKKDYGTELDENAVNLVHAAIGLQDDFSLPDFDKNRQGMLIALVACCPRKAAPTIIEQFFNHQYSVVQRSVMLTALAQGARELAGIEAPSTQPIFPSKQLPPAKHRKLISMGNEIPMQRAIEELANLVIDKQASVAETQMPAIAREKQLRIRKPTRAVTDVNAPPPRTTATTFKDVSTEFFIMPFVNRFWGYLRDEQTREQRTALSSSRYQGAGTGMILSPLMLGQILATFGVLMDAARFAPTYLAVLAPEVLELALTLGSRMVTTVAPAQSQGKQQADVVVYAAQVSLIIFDASLELDGGRTLAMEHSRLVAAVGEWARALFENEEKGVRLEGAGSVGCGNLERVAASLVLKVHDLLDKWRGAMISGM